MLSALQLVATPAAQPLADALVVIKDMYRKQSRKVPATAPLEFVPESWRKVVITPAGIDRQYLVRLRTTSYYDRANDRA